MANFGNPDLQLPGDLREPLLAHLDDLRQKYLAMGWGEPTGYGSQPALVVIDLALYWTRPQHQIGADLEPVLNATLRILAAARSAGIPVFFSTFAYDPADPPSPQNRKLRLKLTEEHVPLFELDPRLERRPDEKIIRKRYASCFKGTNFHEMLTSLGVDTLIVTGVSTSHCVYATCRDATDSFRVIVPEDAVGERCELMHLVNLLDIGIDLGDVRPTDEVEAWLDGLQTTRSSAAG